MEANPSALRGAGSRPHVALMRRANDNVHERMARVQLLLGVSEESEAGRSAWTIVVTLRKCEIAMLQEGEPESLGQVRANRLAATGELDRFNRAARREIRAGYFSIARTWFQRKIARARSRRS